MGKGEDEMSQIKMNLPKELEICGMYPAEGLWYGMKYPPVEQLNLPISPKENLLRYFHGEDYEWVPDLVSDMIHITPHCNPDVDASDFEGGYDVFGVKWIPVEGNSELPAFVEPGFKLLEDIADWPSLKWPDVDAWEWESYAKRYNETYRDDGRMRRGVVFSGYFERLISIMGFEDAAVSLITDPESVTAFFDKLTELNIRIMKHYIEDFGCQAIMVHDDWSAQRSPFFSLSTAEELLVPQVKKLVDYAHGQGVIFTLHSCGNGLELIPAIKATGADTWQAQSTALDLEAAYEACGDELILETDFEVPDGLKGKALEQFAGSIVEKYCVRHKGLVEFFCSDEEQTLELRKYVYQISRRLAAEGKSK